VGTTLVEAVHQGRDAIGIGIGIGIAIGIGCRSRSRQLQTFPDMGRLEIAACSVF
jgi:hypothetical protein